MKEGIHPKYNNVTVSCACGNEFETRSTKSEIRLEICSACHPFFTGKQKLVDSGGRVERFQRRYGRTTFTREQPAADESAEAAADPTRPSRPVRSNSAWTLG